jgi:hypothetical protein
VCIGGRTPLRLNQPPCGAGGGRCGALGCTRPFTGATSARDLEKEAAQTETPDANQASDPLCFSSAPARDPQEAYDPDPL